MERLLVIWCPGLVEEQEDGRGARAFARVVEATAAFSPVVDVVRPGVCAVPTRGPSRYFGGDERLARRLEATLSDLPVGGAQIGVGKVQVGVADGLFAAMLAARAAIGGPVVVDPGGTPAFLAPWPVEVLERPELADLLWRLGIRTLGSFAALPARHVVARLGADGAACHAVAGGVRGEPAGIRVPCRTLVLAGDRGAPRQAGFWGQAAAAEARADRAVAQVVALVGPEAVAVGRLQGGRGPADRARLVPWTGRRVDGTGPGAEPWPGQIPSPAPVVVLERPRPAVLIDAGGEGVGVGAGGVISAAPARLSVSGAPWAAVAGWAGPWPADEQWWSGRARRRRARLQLVTETGAAYLLVREHGGWWVEGVYD